MCKVPCLVSPQVKNAIAQHGRLGGQSDAIPCLSVTLTAIVRVKVTWLCLERVRLECLAPLPRHRDAPPWFVWGRCNACDH
jgi:hypothetical protein